MLGTSDGIDLVKIYAFGGCLRILGTKSNGHTLNCPATCSNEIAVGIIAHELVRDASAWKPLILDSSDKRVDPGNNHLAIIFDGIGYDAIKPVVEPTRKPVQRVSDVLVGWPFLRRNVGGRPDLVDQNLPVFRQQRR